MKAGDLLVSSANTWTSWGIRIGTVSRVSHVAMAISCCRVIESVPTGTCPKLFSKFLDDNHKVYLLERPTALTSSQVSLLRTSAFGIRRPGYNLPRSLTSGVVRTGFWVWLLCLIMVNATLIRAIDTPWLLLAGYNFLMVLLFLVIYICARPESFNIVVEKLGLPKFLQTDVEKHFCSQLVIQLDQVIQGGLSKGSIPLHEFRPKDVLRRALKQGYTCRRLKP